MIYFFTSIVFVNLFIYYHNYFFLFLLITNLYMLGKRINTKLYVISCIGVALFFSLNSNYYSYQCISPHIKKNLTVLEAYENYSIVGDNRSKYLIYNGENVLKNGYNIYIEGTLIDIKETYDNFYNYLNKKAVNYKLDYYNLVIIESHNHVNERIIESLLSKKNDKSKSFLKLILFNIKDEYNIDFYNTFSLYSLTYLIAVSGFHIRLLLSFFKKVFHNNAISIAIVSFYLYLLDFSVSSYRAFLCYIFKRINRMLGFCLSNIDIISLIGSVFIFYNPSLMFSLGFIYSFLATFVLEIFKLYKAKQISIAFYVYAINIPLILLNNYKLNFSSLFFSCILTKSISFLYIFSFIFLFLDKFYLLYEFTISLFYKLFAILDKFNFIVIFGRPSVYFIILYYLLMIMFFVHKEQKSKYRYLFLCFIFILLFYQYCKPLINKNEQVYFLNVGQGDSSIFFIPHSKEVVMVDTGGSKYKDIATSEIIPFLESKGVNKIRSVILTHDDFDHIGSLESLKSNFKVETVINTSTIEEIPIGNKRFKNLNINENRDNDGSVVLYGSYANYNLLLMGDASKKIEAEIIDKVEKVDIVKIGHHGSNTSSDYEFLRRMGGKIAIISVGANNIYGHPHEEVIETLNRLGYVILRTDKNNDIGFGKNIFGLSFIDYFN